MVSQRVARLVAESPVIAVAHLRAEADPFHPERNPDGYLNLGTAENRLVWDLLADRLRGAREVMPIDVRYGPLHGSDGLRAATAGLLSRTWRVEVDPENLIVVAGATAALDVIASVLCDPGDALVIPAPYYAAFDIDLAGRSDARIISAPLSPADGFRLDPMVIDRALNEARGAGVTVRAIVLASPDNPTGQVRSIDTLRNVLAVAEKHGVDVIADEIYANSGFGAEEFVSVLDPRVRNAAVHTHAIWGFAKDFGLPGLKAGVLHTDDPDIRAGARALAYFAPLSTDTQALLRDLLADEQWVADFLRENQERLRRSYRATVDLLDAHQIPYLPADAGFAVWIDLGRWMDPRTFAAEKELWQLLWTEIRLNILPGQVFACAEPGWFRVCHSVDPVVVREGLTRLGGLLRTRSAARVSIAAGDR